MRWTKKEVIYQIFVDRFAPVDEKKAKKPIFAGGNLKGIISHLKHLENLGVTAIWLSPIYEGTAYHGYFITDFMKVDERFGTMDDFKELIKKCHEKNIKVMLDFVPNHVSSHHYFFQEAIHQENKGFKKWFYIKDDEHYKCFFDYKNMPKLNLDHEVARIYVTEAAKYWISLGVDGLRLDHAIGPSIDFWNYFVSDVKKMHPDCLLLGEVWADTLSWKQLQSTNAKNKILKWLTKANSTDFMKDYDGLLDGCIDFTFNRLLREYMFKHEHKETFAQELVKHYKQFSKEFLLPVFLDNHDMDRFYFDCKDKEQYKKAIDIMFAQEQPVIIYYGDESGMTQEKHFSDFKEHGDLQARQAMNWKTMDEELIEYFKKKIILKLKE